MTNPHWPLQSERLIDRLLNTPEAAYTGPGVHSLGHHGLGGSIGICDPDAGIGFAHCCNMMHAVGTNAPRPKRLIETL